MHQSSHNWIILDTYLNWFSFLLPYFLNSSVYLWYLHVKLVATLIGCGFALQSKILNTCLFWQNPKVEAEEEAGLEEEAEEGEEVEAEEAEEGVEVELQLVWVGSSMEACQSCAPLEMVRTHTCLSNILLLFTNSFIQQGFMSIEILSNPNDGPYIHCLFQKKSHTIIFCWTVCNLDYGTHSPWHHSDTLLQCHNIYSRLELHSFFLVLMMGESDRYAKTSPAHSKDSQWG